MSEQKSTVEQVLAFHELFEHPIGTLEGSEPLKIRQLRIKLLFEELKELAEASDVRKTFYNLCLNTCDSPWHSKADGNNVDRVEELDALCDLQYVLDGKKLTSGLYEIFDQAFDLIHENNMKKAHRSQAHVVETSAIKGVTLECIERNGVFVAVDENGKTTKPHDHKKVDLTPLFKTIHE